MPSFAAISVRRGRSNFLPSTGYSRTIDGLMREGSDVIQNGKTHLTGIGPLHLSGHAYFGDHVQMINAINPKFYMPIHGEFHMLVHNAEIAEREAGIKREN